MEKMRNCFIKSNNMLKKIILFVWIFIGICFNYNVYGNDLIEEIIELAEEERAINRQIIEAMTFELAQEQIPIAGDNEKYIITDINNNLWLFKPGSEIETQNAKMVSDIAQLLDINVAVLGGRVLPINGREVFGLVQKIGFNDILRFEKISIRDLSYKNIFSLQKLQVLDWLLVVHNNELYDDGFIASKTGDEILAIDRDDCFMNVNDCKILGIKAPIWGDSLYGRLWDSYLEGEIDINFSEVFELINYIQHIADNEFLKILDPLNSGGRQIFLKEVIWRKDNLKNEFGKLYSNLAEKRGKVLDTPREDGYKNYLEKLLQKKKEQVVAKKLEYKWMIDKGEKKQKKIEVISAREVWRLICKLLDGDSNDANMIIEKAQLIKKDSTFIGERLAIELYIRQLKTKQKINIHRIVTHPKIVGPIEIEYNLRISNYDIFLNNSSSIKALKEEDDVVSHLRYMEIMKMQNRNEEVISEYKRKLEANPDDITYLFLAVMSQSEYRFNKILNKVTMADTDTLEEPLDELDNKFPWKYYGLALCDYGEGRIEEGIKKCEKIIKLNNNNEAIYAAYMLLGFFYEHKNNIRFGKGFDIKKAIEQYKKALKVKPNSVEAHLNLGNLYLIKNLPAQALESFKKTEKLNPDYGYLYFHLDNIKKRDAYKNSEGFIEAIKMNTLSGEDHYILGLVYEVTGQHDLARNHRGKSKEFGWEENIGLKQ